MPSLLLVVFLLQLTIHLINTVGAVAISEILWSIYNRLPNTSTSKTLAEHKALQKEFLKLRTELNATSSQDEFAKWAKLRRQHDKVVEELEKKKNTILTTRTKFTSIVSTLRWVLTNGLRFLLQFIYTKQAIYYLPKGWFPYYAEWLLSFPRAPMGSVSIQAWFLACTAAIILVGDGLGALLGLVKGGGKKTGGDGGFSVPEKGGEEQKVGGEGEGEENVRKRKLPKGAVRREL